jgi:serine/threonine protein kinase
MKEIISAVKYLHNQSPPIIHRDIKPENILIDQNGNCKLADFGWASFDNGRKDIETYCGTPEYLAPEMVNRSGHDKSVDIWALGILLFEMLTGRTPFSMIGDKNELFNSIIISKINWTDDFPYLAKDLVSKILCINPNNRPSLDEIINHQWFRDTPSLRPYLKPNHHDEKQKLELNLIYYNPDKDKFKNIDKKFNLSKKQILIKLIKNNENTFKENNQDQYNNLNQIYY